MSDHIRMRFAVEGAAEGCKHCQAFLDEMAEKINRDAEEMARIKSLYLPGLIGDDDEVMVFDFTPPRRVYVAKWWSRPIYRLLRRPTRIIR